VKSKITQRKLYCGSVTCWHGSGSAPLTNGSGFESDPDPDIFVSDLQDGNQTFCLLLFEGIKKSQNSRNQGFACYFWLFTEGSGAGSEPRITGSRSRKPKNLRTPIRILTLLETVQGKVAIYILRCTFMPGPASSSILRM